MISTEKIKAMIKASLLDSTMVASNERPSKRSTVIFFVGLKRITEELHHSIKKRIKIHDSIKNESKRL